MGVQANIAADVGIVVYAEKAESFSSVDESGCGKKLQPEG